ncbi:MAG TPA: hypothetical protein VNW97_23305 [Candidatus Saccharimonadales bacterium]|jgi:cation transport ATPase|nr:hypothetical protein [Candidatus Saccharimonadales bacterium]
MPTLTGLLQGQSGEAPPSKDHDGANGPDKGHGHSVSLADLSRVAFVALAAAAVAFHIYEPFPSFSLIGVAATMIGGYPIFREALENILERRMTMELSMTIALIAALLIREFFTALVITLFVLVAEILEQLTVGRGRKAIRQDRHSHIWRSGCGQDRACRGANADGTSELRWCRGIEFRTSAG